MGEVSETLKKSKIIVMENYPYIVSPFSGGMPCIKPEQLSEIADFMEKSVSNDCDYILTPECAGIAYGSIVADRKKIPLVIVRKKSVHSESEIVIESTTGYSKNRFFMPTFEKGDKIAIVDDVFSTGGTVGKLSETIRKMGASVTEAVVIYEKSDDLKKAEAELGFPVKALVSVKVENGKVVIR